MIFKEILKLIFRVDLALRHFNATPADSLIMKKLVEHVMVATLAEVEHEHNIRQFFTIPDQTRLESEEVKAAYQALLTWFENTDFAQASLIDEQHRSLQMHRFYRD